MRRIAKTAFPGRYTVRGTQRYIAVPVIAEERMGLKDGDFLDVIIRWPKTEQYEVEEENEASDDAEKPRRGRKRKKTEE